MGAPSEDDAATTGPATIPASDLRPPPSVAEAEEAKPGERKIRPLWTLPLEGPPVGTILIGPNAYFVPLEGGGIQVFDLPPGEDCGAGPSGSRTIPTRRFDVPPLLLDDLLVWGEGGELVAWDLLSERELWRREGMSAGVLAGDRARVYSREAGSVRAFGIRTGAGEWSVSLPDPSGPITLTPAHLLVPSGGWMVGLDPETGRERFRAPIGRERNSHAVASPAVLVHGTVYWGADDRTVTSLVVRGDLPRRVFRKWNLRRGGVVAAAPVPFGRGLLVLSLDNELAWVQAKDGFRIWRNSTALRPLGGPVLAEGLVIVAGHGGSELGVFRAGTGEALEPIPSDDPDRWFLTPPAMDGGRHGLVTVTGPWGYRLVVYDIRTVEALSSGGK